MILYEWAKKHQVSQAALDDLNVIFGLNGGHAADGESEAAIQNEIRLEAASKGLHLFRNNVGVLLDVNARPVRFGLANDSKRLNDKLKSGDLIGWRRVVITQEMVGCTIAQFVSRECKRKDWKYSGDARETAQLAWARLVTASGGDACFATGTGTL